MKKADALRFYDGDPQEMARAIHVTKQAVSQWGPVIPLASAFRLEAATRGKLRVDLALYDGNKPKGKARA